MLSSIPKPQHHTASTNSSNRPDSIYSGNTTLSTVGLPHVASNPLTLKQLKPIHIAKALTTEYITVRYPAIDVLNGN
jgi:hypothetical protein